MRLIVLLVANILSLITAVQTVVYLEKRRKVPEKSPKATIGITVQIYEFFDRENCCLTTEGKQLLTEIFTQRKVEKIILKRKNEDADSIIAAQEVCFWAIDQGLVTENIKTEISFIRAEENAIEII